VVANGAVQSDKKVSGGAITLDLAASKVHIGLSYGWIYRGMKLPYGSQTGPGVGQTKSVNGLVFVLRDAASFDYAVDLAGDGDEEASDLVFASVPFRKPTDSHERGLSVVQWRGLVDPPSGNGFSTDPRVVMQGTAPMPWTLLGIQPRIYGDRALIVVRGLVAGDLETIGRDAAEEWVRGMFKAGADFSGLLASPIPTSPRSMNIRLRRGDSSIRATAWQSRGRSSARCRPNVL
jgi:hypothetical protein